MSSRVYVGELNPSAVKGDLEREFDRYGRLRDVWVARNPPGFAFVEFEDYRDAEVTYALATIHKAGCSSRS